MRPYSMDANGTMTEVARDAGMGLPNDFFNNGATVYLSVEFVDEKPVLTLKAVTKNSYVEHTYTFGSRVANEISAADAKPCFWLRTDAVTSLKVYHSTAWAERD